jgi:PAS domain S-box-containing protein
VTQSETILFAIATILYFATMIFVVLMLREGGDRRPWLMLLAALFSLFAFRVIGFYVSRDTRQELGPWVGVLASAWLLASLFYFRAITVAERESKLLAERRTTERDESESRYRALAELCPDVMYVEVDGRICYVNAAAVQFFGASDVSQLIGRSPVSLAGPESRNRVAAREKRLTEIGQSLAVESEEWLRLDGSRVPVETAAAVVPWQGTTGILVMLRDVSERRKVEEQRAQLLVSERAARSEAERASRMKDEFLATLSHELRTPLTAIVGWSQILVRGRSSSAEIAQGIDAVDRNARALTKLVEDLLDMSSILSGKLRLDMQAVAPRSFVEAAIETIKPTAEAKRVRLESELDTGVSWLRGDANRLQQVVWNLLTNAVKFTPEGGLVRVVLKQAGSRVQLSVTDTGQGISAEFLPFVFDRFRQADASIRRRHGGLGIGLAIVKQLVELHGGDVAVKSAGEGLGTTFVVSLPVVRLQQGPLLEPRDSDASRGDRNGSAVDLSGLNVLVVDDEPDSCRLVKLVLRECHADVVIASSALEGLQLIETAAPDILISDIGMPDVDGYEFLRRLRALETGHARNVPAIALTAFAHPEDEAKSLAAGYSIHLSKPVAPETLAATVASLMGRPKEAGSAS